MSRDPGLQPERTSLSWQRTGVATLIAGAAAAAVALHRGEPLAAVVALAALALAAVTAVPPWRPPAQESTGEGTLPFSPPYPRLVRAAVATIALAAVGLLLALT